MNPNKITVYYILNQKKNKKQPLHICFLKKNPQSFIEKKLSNKKMYQWFSSWFGQEKVPQTIPKNGITSQQLQSIKLRAPKKQDRCPFSGYQLKEMKKALKPISPSVVIAKQDPEAIFVRNNLRPTYQQWW